MIKSHFNEKGYLIDGIIPKTFLKRCKYCNEFIDVENERKTTCYNCRMKRIKEYSQKLRDKQNEKT